MGVVILRVRWIQILDTRFIRRRDCRPGVTLDSGQWLPGNAYSTMGTYRRILAIRIPTIFQHVEMSPGIDGAGVRDVATDIRTSIPLEFDLEAKY